MCVHVLKQRANEQVFFYFVRAEGCFITLVFAFYDCISCVRSFVMIAAVKKKLYSYSSLVCMYIYVCVVMYRHNIGERSYLVRSCIVTQPETFARSFQHYAL